MKAEDRYCWWKTFFPNLPLLFASWKSENSPHISETNDLHWINPAWASAEPMIPSLEGWAAVGACNQVGSAVSQPANLGKNRQGSKGQPQNIWEVVFRLGIIFPWKNVCLNSQLWRAAVARSNRGSYQPKTEPLILILSQFKSTVLKKLCFHGKGMLFTSL